MKKITCALSACAVVVSFAMANDANFATNFKQILKNDKAHIISNDKLSSFNGSNLVIADVNGKKEIFLASDDGKNLIPLTKKPMFSNAHDEMLYNAKTKILLDENDAVALELIKSLPKDRFATINSYDKNNPFITYIVGDPECPDCLAEMKKITKHLRNSNVKLVFAPVHGNTAFIKSALILKELREISPDDQNAAIKIIDKYYDMNTKVSSKDISQSEVDAVYNDAKHLFSKGVITWVPYSIKVEK